MRNLGLDAYPLAQYGARTARATRKSVEIEGFQGSAQLQKRAVSVPVGYERAFTTVALLSFHTHIGF